jgi:hypothetical protein
MTASRKFGVFAIAFAITYPIVYLVATEKNLALFTYHPALGVFGLGPNRPIAGPAMYWYGWISTSVIIAALFAIIAAHLPERMTQRLPATLAWVVPLVAIATACCLMINMYFTR